LVDPAVLRLLVGGGFDVFSPQASTAVEKIFAQMDAWEEAELLATLTTDLVHDTDADLLENRLILFAQKQKEFSESASPADQLALAKKSSKELARKVRRELLLNLHGRSGKLKTWATVFTDTELFYIANLGRAAAGNHALVDPRLRSILNEKMIVGRGLAAMQFLTRVFGSQPLRASEKVWRGPTELNLKLASRWADPKCPTWMLSGEAGAAVLRMHGLKVADRDAFHTLTRDLKLFRLKPTIDSVLLKYKDSIPLAKHLLDELTEAAGNYVFANTRPGRPKGPKTAGKKRL
jgi:hypothetical protein